MITDVPGVRVGHWTDTDAATGCTVILLPENATGAYVLAGGAPGTRETDVLGPANLVSQVHAFVLTGGSAFGLAAADGVMRWLERAGVGFQFGPARVPIVPSAVIFDLSVGDPAVRPGPAEGEAACEAAGTTVAEGSVGAGTGATVAKRGGPATRMKGGLGTASRSDGDLVVGAIVVCNAAGDVVDERGEPITARGPAPPGAAPVDLQPGQSTVLAAVVSNAVLDKAATTHVARMAAAGIARAVRPAFTRFDGDVVFAASTGAFETEVSQAGALAAEAVEEALRRGVRAAVGLAGVPGLADGPGAAD